MEPSVRKAASRIRKRNREPSGSMYRISLEEEVWGNGLVRVREKQAPVS
jgi:hypothetical protein